MNLIKIAWRNIWRNKLRSLAIIFSVILGLVAAIFSSALVIGMMDGRFQNFIENEISHIQIHHPDFIGQNEVYQTTGVNKSILSDILQVPDVKAATIRTKTHSMIASATTTRGIQLWGISPEQEEKTTNLTENLIEGKYLTAADKNQIIIGKMISNKLKVSVGSKVVLTFQDIENDIVSAAFVVKGIFETYSNRYDENNAFVPINSLNEYLKLGEEFHELALVSHHIDHLDALIPLLQEILPELTIRKWNEISPELDYWIEVGGIFSYIFVIVILIALAFGLLNTMLMAVFERTREIGMLMAIGMNKKKVFGLIVFETIILSLIGTIIGMLLGYWLVISTSRKGIDLSALSDVMKEIGFDSMIYPQMDITFYWVLPFFVVSTALLAAIYPAVKALRLNPAEAVRE